MSRQLDVLLIESYPGIGDRDAEMLSAAGHRVSRCFTADGADTDVNQSVCVGVRERTCPLDHAADVALLVRDATAAGTTSTEIGVMCALRAGVPVVSNGSGVPGPFDGWLLACDADDVAASCVNAVEHSFDYLRGDIDARVSPVLAEAGLSPDSLHYDFETSGRDLSVAISGPSLPAATKETIAIRLGDALRSDRREFSRKSVSYTALDVE